MTNNQYRIEFTSDLSRGITVTPIRFALLSNENMAHAFVIKTTRNGQKNDLTGSNVRAYFIPASQNLSVLIDGEVDQNGNAVIELTKDCYYYTGRFFLIIETEMDNVTSCIFYGDGYVTKTSTDEIVAPPETVGIISAVLYNKPQSLTDAQKQQARANIGAISEVDVPQKGVHYWTPADQESIVQQVIAALGTPVFGTIDEDNHITLTGKFVDGNYTFSIEDEEGKSYFDGSFSKQSYINQIPISTDTDGSVYNGVGYKTASRGNSSGEIVDLAGGSNPPFCTGFIPCKQGDVIRLKNCYIHATTQDNDSFKALYGNTGPWGVRFGLYNSSKANIAVESWGNLSQSNNATNILSDYTRVPEGTGLTQGMIYQFKIAYANTAYIRLCLAADVANGFTAADAIVTVNQEIG